MRFWDTSAIVPLLVEEQQSPVVRDLLTKDRTIAVWWGTSVECAAGLSRRQRDQAYSDQGIEQAFRVLDALMEEWLVVTPTSSIAAIARRLLRVHTLRAADSLQLAAAIQCADGDPHSIPLVSFDRRLRDAAVKQGFPLLPVDA